MNNDANKNHYLVDSLSLTTICWAKRCRNHENKEIWAQ